MFTKDMRAKTIASAKTLSKQKELIDKLVNESAIHLDQETQQKLKTARKEYNNLFIGAVERLEEYTKDFLKVIDERFTPHGADLTPDAKIFETDIELSDEEIKVYILKYKDNLTMLRLIVDYARKNGIDIDIEGLGSASIVICGKEKMILSANRLLNYCKSALTNADYIEKIFTDDDKYKRICGEELAND